jgi:hypothetical protein
MEASAVVLTMLFNLNMIDILCWSAKSKSSYNVGKNNAGYTYIGPNSVSSAM